VARPQKQTVEYFPHFVHHRKTLSILEHNWGNNGYAFWFKLLELLGKTEGHYIDCNKQDEWDFLVSYTKSDEETARAVLNKLASIDAIDKELWEHRLIWCQKFVNNLKILYDKRTVDMPEKPSFRDENPTEEGFSGRKPPVSGVSGDGNPQSKVKKSKVKESKEFDGLSAVETSYFNLFEQEFGNKPDYKYPRDRKIIKDYLKNYPVEQIVELLQIWFYCQIGDWNGYTITGLIKDFNKLLVTWQKLGMNRFTPEEYDTYVKNVEKINREHKKNIEVPPYEKWREENFQRRFEEVNVPP